jgi:ribonuclease H2 subunit A
MVYGIAFCPVSQAEILKTLKCDDSKILTEQKRDEIFENINQQEYATQNMGWAIEVISPNVISMCMFRRVKHSLNEVSMDSAIGLINRALASDVNVTEIYVDTVGPPEKYQDKLKKLFPQIEKIVVAKKADSTYPIVSAASICAKVSRDHCLKVWKFREGLDSTCDEFGSGYPGDPKTKNFIKNPDPVFGYARLVRFSWSTATNALQHNGALDVIFDDVDEEAADQEKPTYGSALITEFYKTKAKKKKGVKGENVENDDTPTKRKRHAFFTERCLQPATF